MPAKLEAVPASDADLRYFAERRYASGSGPQLYTHLAETARGGAWIVRDDVTPIAIGFAHGSDDEAFVSELFVEPSFRAGGIANVMLRQMFPESDVARAALLDPSDSAALGLALRTGLSLQTPVLRLAGAIPKEDELAALAFGAYRFRAVAVDPGAHRYALDALDREVRGTARFEDHVMFSSIAKGATIFLDDECVGYVYAWPDGRVGPIVASSGAYMQQLFALALVMLGREFGATWCSAGIPGTNVRAMRAALRIGLRIDLVRCFATDVALGDLTRYVGYHPLLF